jgi:hypothetical protein
MLRRRQPLSQENQTGLQICKRGRISSPCRASKLAGPTKASDAAWDQEPPGPVSIMRRNAYGSGGTPETHSRTVGSVRQGTAAVCLAPSDRRVLQTLVRRACSAVGESDGKSANAIAATEKLCSSMRIARIAGTAGRPIQSTPTRDGNDVVRVLRATVTAALYGNFIRHAREACSIGGKSPCSP